VRAKKKSEMTPEDLAARAAVVPGTGPTPAASAQEAVAPAETSETAVTSAAAAEPGAPEAAKVYTGPVRAKKKSAGG